MFTKLKQFKDLRNQAKELQQKLSEESVTVRSSGDKISLTMDGNLAITALSIDPELLSAEKKQRLEESLISAHNEAVKKIQKIMAIKMKEMGGLPNIPGITS